VTEHTRLLHLDWTDKGQCFGDSEQYTYLAIRESPNSLANIWCSSVYEITDLVFALVSGFSLAFIGFYFLFLAGGGQLSQSYLKLFVFDSSSCAGTVALFWSFQGVPLGFISLFIFSLATC
jgi:hypothetical protein